jgi:hypothetical protein
MFLAIATLSINGLAPFKKRVSKTAIAAYEAESYKCETARSIQFAFQIAHLYDEKSIAKSSLPI